MKKTILLSALVALLVSVFTLGAYQYLNPAANTLEVKHVNGESAQPVLYTRNNAGTFEALDFTQTAAAVTDAVVHIKSTSTGQNNPLAQRRSPQGNPFGQDDFFERFFGPQFGPPQGGRQSTPRNQPRVGTGSGVVINPEGYIVTNNHVIDGADDIEVLFNDNRSFKAELIGTDPTTDIALLKIDTEGLQYLPMVDSDNVQVGQWVMAVGNPFNLNSTVTAGIVSAKGRAINILQEQYAIEDFIQTDAAINPGNSGGALVNLDGSLVGINTAIASPTGAYSGYGFAVPANIVKKVVRDLREYGVVQRGLIGAMIRQVDQNLAEERGLSRNYGVLVDSLVAGSAALDAGIESGDVIVAVEDRTIKTRSDLLGMIARYRPGETVTFTVERDGTDREFPVVLNNENGTTDVVEKDAPVAVAALLGVELEEVRGGVRVTDIDDGPIDEQTKMKRGFVITGVDGQRVLSVDDLNNALRGKRGGVMLEGRYPGDNRPYYYAFGL